MERHMERPHGEQHVWSFSAEPLRPPQLAECDAAVSGYTPMEEDAYGGGCGMRMRTCNHTDVAEQPPTRKKHIPRQTFLWLSL